MSLLPDLSKQPKNMRYIWRFAERQHIPRIHKLVQEIHPSCPERLEVFENRFTLYPQGVFVLVDKLVLNSTENLHAIHNMEHIVGYFICHPWYNFQIPPFDTILSSVPPTPITGLVKSSPTYQSDLMSNQMKYQLYISDCSCLPEAQGSSCAAMIFWVLLEYAKLLGYKYMSVLCMNIHSVRVTSTAGFHPAQPDGGPNPNGPMNGKLNAIGQKNVKTYGKFAVYCQKNVNYTPVRILENKKSFYNLYYSPERNNNSLQTAEANPPQPPQTPLQWPQHQPVSAIGSLTKPISKGAKL